MAKVLCTKWYDETVKALQINGKSRRSQECCARAVRMLIEHFGKEPDEITEEELRDYFLYRKNDCNRAPNTMKICHCGIRFFYEHVIRRDWHIFNILKSEKERRLPCVLSRKEVYDIPSHVRTFHNCTHLATVYVCGLRLQEALYLQVADIDKDRMLIHIHRGKGAADRYVPLPEVGEGEIIAQIFEFLGLSNSVLRLCKHCMKNRPDTDFQESYHHRLTAVQYGQCAS